MMPYGVSTSSVRWSFLLPIFLLHVLLLLNWRHLALRQNSDREQPARESTMQLTFFATPSRVLPKTIDSSPVISRAITTHTSRTPPAVLPVPVAVDSAVSASDKRGEPVAAELTPRLNRDIRAVYSSLRKDFQAQERGSASAVPQMKSMDAFGRRIAAAAVSRDNFREESHTLFDGRPVTKVITPSGSYCILHRKAGEIIGNEMPGVPMSCGHL
ncbi:MAG: hypothetical protein KGM99_17035 [Burkholderiales bacterium]|nr:hypothetical protein [Burkholderiales bacterium]